jgi:hypothetical protein
MLHFALRAIEKLHPLIECGARVVVAPRDHRMQHMERIALLRFRLVPIGGSVEFFCGTLVGQICVTTAFSGGVQDDDWSPPGGRALLSPAKAACPKTSC